MSLFPNEVDSDTDCKRATDENLLIFQITFEKPRV